MGINKVQYGNTVLIDLTDTTAEAADVLAGKYFYGKDGVKTLGTGTGGIDGDNLGYGNYVPAIVGQAIVGLSLVGEQTQPIVGTALAGLTQIGE